MKHNDKAAKQMSLLDVDARDAGTVAFELENLQNQIATCLKFYDEIVFLLNLDVTRLLEDARFTAAVTPAVLKDALTKRNDHLSLQGHLELDRLLTLALKDMDTARLLTLRDGLHAMEEVGTLKQTE